MASDTDEGAKVEGCARAAGERGAQAADAAWVRPPARFGVGARREVRVKDDLLARVLAGEALLLFDGAMGTQLQERGMAAGELPELLCLTDPALVTDVHASYVRAGADVVTTNTFGACRQKLVGKAGVEEVFRAAVACARAARPHYVAADIGPTGSLLEPMGTLPFERAYDLFAEEALAAEAAGADLVVVETMADLSEARAAVLACKEMTSLPVFCTMTFGEDGRTFLGTTPEVAAATLSALGADVVGINCSLGPAEVAPLVERMLPWSRVPVMAQANAGLPVVVDGETTYGVGVEEYARAVAGMLDAGVTVVGGCCGTTPAYVAAERALLDEREPRPREARRDFVVASSQELCALGAGDVGVIGERINPTGKRRMKEALRSGNLDYVMGLAIEQTEAGAQILDVNAGLPEIDERATMLRLVDDLPGVTGLPLQIDSAVPATVEAAVRRYAGKALVNSTNGRRDTMAAVIPVAAHYGCALVGLTIDEEGIPRTAEGRLAIARRIVEEAGRWGIPHEDVAIDCLAMAASTDQEAPRAILDGIRLVKRELPGVRTVLGVSNISFGLPFRPLVNATFLAAAFSAGLDLAIVNPTQQRMMDVVSSWRVLSGEDESAQAYVAAYADRTDAPARPAAAAGEKGAGPSGGAAGPDAGAGRDGATGGAASNPDAAGPAGGLERRAFDLVLSGRKGPMPEVVRGLLADHDAMYCINEVLIPALDEVGDRFERGRFFLPQLMASAEAAKAGFNEIKAHQSGAGEGVAPKGKVALATVKGDIHDIGKNIVRMLLENYGYDVIDLGRDVDPQDFCDAVVRDHVPLAGLSALMTATVPAMAETIALLREQAPWCKVMVGGAVLNPEYAEMVGADFYAKDANESARIAERVLG